MATGDEIGGRGEAIFYVRVTDLCGRKRPFFRPHFLGEKFAALDYLVELIDAGEGTPFFFVQVKTTRRGQTRGTSAPCLNVRVSARDLRRMILYPAPTYVVGIDEREEEGYILAVHGDMRGQLSALPMNHPLDCNNLQMLWEEVREFWDQRDMVMKKSVFSIQDRYHD
jgi:hypothetical protein